MAFDPSSFTGSLGGIIAIAWGAGAASGYAFCLRTMYKILREQASKDEVECAARLEELKKEKQDLAEQVESLQRQLIGGLERQLSQTSQSGLALLDKRTKKDG